VKQKLNFKKILLSIGLWSHSHSVRVFCFFRESVAASNHGNSRPAAAAVYAPRMRYHNASLAGIAGITEFYLRGKASQFIRFETVRIWDETDAWPRSRRGGGLCVCLLGRIFKSGLVVPKR